MLWTRALAPLLFISSFASLHAKTFKLDLPLDPLLEIPESFEMNQDEFEEAFAPPEGWKEGNPYFSW